MCQNWVMKRKLCPSSKKDLTNQTLANVIRQLACLTQFAEEIIGESSNALANQQSRLESLSGRIEVLDQKVQVLNPKQVGTVINCLTKTDKEIYGN